MYCISHVLTHLQPASKSLIYVLNIIYAAVAIRESYPSKGPQHQVVSGPYLSVCLGGFLDARTTHRASWNPPLLVPFRHSSCPEDVETKLRGMTERPFVESMLSKQAQNIARQQNAPRDYTGAGIFCSAEFYMYDGFPNIFAPPVPNLFFSIVNDFCI